MDIRTFETALFEKYHQQFSIGAFAHICCEFPSPTKSCEPLKTLDWETQLGTHYSVAHAMKCARRIQIAVLLSLAD